MRRFAAVAAAGELAAALGIVPWPKGAAFNAALWLFRLWREHRGGSQNAERIRCYERLRDYIERHQGNFATANSSIPKPCAGYVRPDHPDHGQLWLLYPATWKLIFAGRDGVGAARKLTEDGILWPTGPKNYQRTMGVPGTGGKRKGSFYVVRGSALAAALGATESPGA
jgi:putative DNA primase/helicase